MATFPPERLDRNGENLALTSPDSTNLIQMDEIGSTRQQTDVVLIIVWLDSAATSSRTFNLAKDSSEEPDEVGTIYFGFNVDIQPGEYYALVLSRATAPGAFRSGDEIRFDFGDPSNLLVDVVGLSSSVIAADN